MNSKPWKALAQECKEIRRALHYDFKLELHFFNWNIRYLLSFAASAKQFFSINMSDAVSVIPA